MAYPILGPSKVGLSLNISGAMKTGVPTCPVIDSAALFKRPTGEPRTLFVLFVLLSIRPDLLLLEEPPLCFLPC